MPLSHLRLTNFRCFTELALPLPEQLVLVGANGRGKSSIIEAITLLALTRSPRARSDAELVKTGETTTTVVGGFGDRRDVRFVVTNERGRLTKQVNRFGSIVPLAQLVGTLKVVHFAAEDIELLTGAPRLRRRLLDSVLIQRSGEPYAQILLTFHRALKQRNSLLARAKSLSELQAAIGVWDLLFVEAASAIIRERRAITQELEIATQRILEAMGVPLMVRVRYQPTIPDLDQLPDLLVARLERDRELGSTSVGPHRDDLSFTVNDRPLGSASRGEQRAVLVALKLAEYERLAVGTADDPPLFLVDDVFSELDPARRSIIATHLAERPCVITTADIGMIPSELSAVSRHELV